MQKIMKFKVGKNGKLLASTALVGFGSLAGSAFAATTPVDTTDILAAIAAAAVAGAAIGTAVLSMHYGIKLFKWVRAAG
jgi:hypothetical protein